LEFLLHLNARTTATTPATWMKIAIAID
jgi:hypothetical protein